MCGDSTGYTLLGFLFPCPSTITWLASPIKGTPVWRVSEVVGVMGMKGGEWGPFMTQVKSQALLLGYDGWG